jgi:excisionase family DNA binding protein
MTFLAQDLRLPTKKEQDTAQQLRSILVARGESDQTLRVLGEGERKPAEITLTPALSSLLIELLNHVGRGDAVTLLPVGKMLSTQQAADILNVSRPYLIGLLESQELPFMRVGRHRRIRSEDLFAYRKRRDQRRGEILSELAQVDGESL